jgi:hypothetical protein
LCCHAEPKIESRRAPNQTLPAAHQKAITPQKPDLRRSADSDETDLAPAEHALNATSTAASLSGWITAAHAASHRSMEEFDGKMRRDIQKPAEPKGTYRVKNWAQYNAGLIARGGVTMWIDQSLFALADAGESRRGRPRVYPDAVIQMLLGLKQVFRLPLRALQGFAGSLCRLAYPAFPVPDYSTLSRRAQDLEVVLPALRTGEPLHLVVDSTGLKVFGEGKWKLRKHGYSKRRTWRKVHLAMDAMSGQICAALMTHQDVGDADVLPDLLDQLPPRSSVDEGARPWQATPGAAWLAAIDTIAESSRARTEKRQRLPPPLAGREPDVSAQDAHRAFAFGARRRVPSATEVAIHVGVLNRIIELARPQSVRVA